MNRLLGAFDEKLPYVAKERHTTYNVYTMKGRFIIGILYVAVSIFFAGTFARATSVIPGTGGFEPVTIELSSQAPEPFQKITAQAKSVRYDMNKISLSWFVNGKEVSSGIGKTSINFEIGAAGSVTTVSVVAEIPSVGAITETMNIAPASVDLLWQSGTYTPPFYRGKALASSAAPLTIVAIPNIFSRQGRKIPAKELVYNWKLNDEAVLSQSGYGRSAIHIVGVRIYGDTQVSVDVSSLDGSVTARKFLLIPSIDPKLVFYEHHPLEGVRYSQALGGTFNLSGREVVVRAEPYFFSNVEALNYQWSLNSQPVEVTREKWNDLTLRQEGTAKGVSKIDLSVQGAEVTRGSALQNAAAALLISFSEQGTGAFLGR